jgi:hypothetical protein
MAFFDPSCRTLRTFEAEVAPPFTAFAVACFRGTDLSARTFEDFRVDRGMASLLSVGNEMPRG